MFLLQLPGPRFDLELQARDLFRHPLQFLSLDLERFHQALSFQREAQESRDFIQQLLLFEERFNFRVVVADDNFSQGLPADAQGAGYGFPAFRLLAIFLALVHRPDSDLIRKLHACRHVLGKVGEELVDPLRLLHPLGHRVEACQFLCPFHFLPVVLDVEVGNVRRPVGSEEVQRSVFGLGKIALEGDQGAGGIRLPVNDDASLTRSDLGHRLSESRQSLSTEQITQFGASAFPGIGTAAFGHQT